MTGRCSLSRFLNPYVLKAPPVTFTDPGLRLPPATCFFPPDAGPLRAVTGGLVPLLAEAGNVGRCRHHEWMLEWMNEWTKEGRKRTVVRNRWQIQEALAFQEDLVPIKRTGTWVSQAALPPLSCLGNYAQWSPSTGSPPPSTLFSV